MKVQSNQTASIPVAHHRSKQRLNPLMALVRSMGSERSEKQRRGQSAKRKGALGGVSCLVDCVETSFQESHNSTKGETNAL